MKLWKQPHSRPFLCNRVPRNRSDTASELAAQILRNMRQAARPSAMTVTFQQRDFMMLERILVADEQKVVLTGSASERPYGFNVSCQLIASDIPLRGGREPVVPLALYPNEYALAFYQTVRMCLSFELKRTGNGPNVASFKRSKRALNRISIRHALG